MRMRNDPSTDPVVILGFGPAAMSAVDALRGVGYAGDIVVVTDGGSLPASPVLTSYYAAGAVDRESCFLWSARDVEERGLTVVPHEPVARLDVAKRTVASESGRTWRFSACLVATGSSPRVDGAGALEACSPLTLRTVDDAEAFAAALGRANANVLVSGTSMVALKAAEACLKRHARVTVLGRSEHILKRAAHPLAAAHMETLVDMQGVNLELGEKVAEARTLPDGALGVRFAGEESARTFTAALQAHGMTPNIDFIADGDLEIDRGIVVDRFMQSSAPGVFAAGDVAQAPCLTGGAGIAGLWAEARAMGVVAGKSMAAYLGCTADRPEDREYPGFLPANTIRVGRALFASAGHVPEDALLETPPLDSATGAPRLDARRACAPGAAFDAAPARCGALASDSATGNDAARPILKETGRRGVYTLKAYAPRADGSLALTGFNMVALADGRGLFDSAADDIGALRAEITRNALQARTT